MAAADVLRQVRPAQVHVVCCGRSWAVGCHSAADWNGAIGFDPEGLAGVLPGAVSDAEVEQMWDLSRTVLDVERRWLNAARVAVGRASGRDWWWSVNLVKKCLASWPYINGKLLLAGVNARELSFADWCDAAYMLLWQGCDERQRIKLDTELSMLPAGVRRRQTKTQKLRMLADFAAD